MFDSTALYYYLGTFLALIAAGVGFPIPEELPIVTAGALVGHSTEHPSLPPESVSIHAVAPNLPFPANLPWAALHEASRYEEPSRIPTLRWWIMLPVCIVGVVLSDGLLYGMGRFWGRRLLEKRWMRRFLPDERRRRIEKNFQEYGVLVLLFARFLPTIRSPIFIMAGIMRVSFTRFLLADGLYAIPGVSLLFALSFWFGDQFSVLVLRAEGQVNKLRPVLILLLLTACAAYLVYHFLRHPVATGDPRESLPLVGGQIAAKIEHASGMHHVPSATQPDADAKKQTPLSDPS